MKKNLRYDARHLFDANMSSTPEWEPHWVNGESAGEGGAETRCYINCHHDDSGNMMLAYSEFLATTGIGGIVFLGQHRFNNGS